MKIARSLGERLLYRIVFADGTKLPRLAPTLARLHLAPMKFKREAAEADPLIAIAGGGGVNLFNSMRKASH